MSSHDYSAFVDTETDRNVLSKLNSLANEHSELIEDVERLTEELKIARAKAEYMVTHRIPEAMDLAEQQEITTASGLRIKVRDKITASIKEENREKAFAWLEANGHGRLIKQNFQIEFGKDEEGWAAKFQRDCAQRKRPLNLKRGKGVHHQTLGAFVREVMGQGVDIPQDILGVYKRREAEVKAVK